MHFLAPPWCDSCGQPQAVGENTNALCAVCLTEPPPYAKARAALEYNEAGRSLIARFKYGDQLHLVPTLTPWLLRAGREVLAGADALVPIPLHWLRLLARRYNQAGLLAQAVGRETSLPVWHNLVRVRRTRPQVGLKREERERNVKKVFAVRQPQRLQGKTLVLVDDVFTTGATLQEATKTLIKAGAKEVRVLTLARVIHPVKLM
jgi:ComF family protein